MSHTRYSLRVIRAELKLGMRWEAARGSQLPEMKIIFSRESEID